LNSCLGVLGWKPDFMSISTDMKHQADSPATRRSSSG
jgi:hypothetical protein